MNEFRQRATVLEINIEMPRLLFLFTGNGAFWIVGERDGQLAFLDDAEVFERLHLLGDRL